ncbi:DNA translocase FtsK 4TM domain-containing protein [Candidatus Nomurabacteria bacterium]|nr:DNA translocase FtsK 4TM domain-containing protein [Candidatus Nomurabacteria bacterium]
MAVRSSKKKTEITIHSKETRVFLGILFFIAGLTVALAPFLDGSVFTKITFYLGLSSTVWGVVLLILSLRLITESEYVHSNKTFLGSILLAVAANIFFSFWVEDTRIVEGADFSQNGGLVGIHLHNILQASVGDFIEFILLIVLALIGFTLLSNTSLSKTVGIIVNSVAGIFGIVPKTIQNVKEGMNKLETEKELVQIVDNNSNISASQDNASSKEFIETQTVIEPLGKESFEEDKKTPKQIEQEQLQFVEANTSSDESDNGDDDSQGLVAPPKYLSWKFPPIELLQQPVAKKINEEAYTRNGIIIEKTLRSFGIESRISKITIGPTIVQYALSITVGTKVARVRNLSNDIALALATPESQIRIEAPIPGTSLIGIEVPNPTPNFVYIKEMMLTLKKEIDNYELPLILGKNVGGKTLIKDLATLPHLLVAGATGTGKSVGINSILTGLLMTKTPDQLRFILVDPKMVELAPYNGIAHLLTPVITDMELVANSLQWAVEEMLRRYRILKQTGVRNIREYNKKTNATTMPYIILIIDEMADLMLSTGVDVESKIVRLTQMARAVGIHLILATQRPSVDVITGLIKANVPGRMAFSVSTAIDSRVIIDQSGAETLIGKGDMLFKSPETGRPIRLQGAWTDTVDTEKLVSFIKDQAQDVEYAEEVTKPKADATTAANGELSEDELFKDALEAVINAQKASSSMLQRKFRIGYNRAARLIDELEAAGAIGPQEGSSSRKVLASSADQILNNENAPQE